MDDFLTCKAFNPLSLDALLCWHTSMGGNFNQFKTVRDKKPRVVVVRRKMCISLWENLLLSRPSLSRGPEKSPPPPPPSQHHQHSDDDSRAPLFFVDAVSKAFFVPLYYMLTQKRPHQIWHLFVLIVFISGAAFVFPATTENLGDNSYSKRTSTTCEESPPF